MIVICIVAFFTNCNNSGGSWSVADQQKGLQTCMGQIEGKLDNATAKKFCSCALEKAMKKWKNYAESEAAPDDDPAGVEIGNSCMLAIQKKGGDDEPGDEPKKGKGLFGGGGWSKSDKEKFMNTCVQNAMNAGADRQRSTAHCDCTLKKIEKKYKSYSDADNNMSKEEMNTIEQECLAGNNNNGDDGGNDDNDDN